MIIVIIILVIFLIFYLKGKNKSQKTFSNNSTEFVSKVSEIPFPDRIDAFSWHMNAINKGISSRDFELANLSYAKLIESIRQQDANEKGNYQDVLFAVRKEYEEFRKLHNLEYPQQFLPPNERKKKEVVIDDTLVFLETLNYYELPKSILKNIDIVRTISQWNELGFKPKQNKDKQWNDIKREDRYFNFEKASKTKPSHITSLETGKRITSKPYFIKELVNQGIKLEEFVNNSEDLKHFIIADDLFIEKKYEEALIEINLAISIRTIKEYKELKQNIQIQLGNEDVAKQMFKENEFDIDSSIHSGEIYEWLKAFLKNNNYDKVKFYIEQTNEILDNLATGKIKAKIYGQQSSDWYVYKKEDFHKNLYKIFEFNSLDSEKSEKKIQIFELIVKFYYGKEIKPIESIADIYSKWNLKEKAIELYNLCLIKLENEEKPRVKSRINKKIEELKIT